jgi:glycosyltransferase involved in cell wall biosynthesis
MRLLIVTPTYWPQGTGGSLATHLLVRLLSKREDLQLSVLTGTTKPDIVRMSNVKYIVDPLVRAIERRFPSPSLVLERYEKILENHDVVYIVYAYTFIRVAKKLKKKVIVHLHDYKPVSPSAAIPSTCSGNPTISKLISDSFKTKYLEHKSVNRMLLNIGDSLRTLLVSKWIQDADAIIAVSKRQAELLAKALPEIKSKLRVIYNPPPPIPQINKEIAKEPTFIYLGGESYLKGFYILLEAITKFLKKGGKARFILAGNYSINCTHHLIHLNKLYGDVIQIAGRTPHAELVSIYRKAWALIFPSICEEPLPYAIMESLSTQTIPLASRIGGVLELIESTELKKFLFNPGDSKDLYMKLLSIASFTRKDIAELQKYVAGLFQYLCHTTLNEDNIMKSLYEMLLQ